MAASHLLEMKNLFQVHFYIAERPQFLITWASLLGLLTTWQLVSPWVRDEGERARWKAQCLLNYWSFIPSILYMLVIVQTNLSTMWEGTWKGYEDQEAVIIGRHLEGHLLWCGTISQTLTHWQLPDTYRMPKAVIELKEIETMWKLENATLVQFPYHQMNESSGKRIKYIQPQFYTAYRSHC